MTYRFFFTFLFLLPFFASAQSPEADDPRAHFVGHNNGQRVYAKRVQVKSPLLKSNYFLLNFILLLIAAVAGFLMLRWLNSIMKVKRVG
mgnify:CR=1 FL=1